jgi:hypothetical protein
MNKLKQQSDQQSEQQLQQQSELKQTSENKIPEACLTKLIIHRTKITAINCTRPKHD